MSDTITSLLDEETTTDATQEDAYVDLLKRLSRQSVVKHFDSYADVPWDEPEMAVDPDDPRWELPHTDPLACHDWYRSQPAGTRSRIGLHRIAVNMKVGLQFESILKRGLLEFAARLPNGSPEFRYAYHEVIEEAHHSLMFQEFVNRTGLEVPGLPWHMEFGARRVIKLGRRFPELFFLFVLGGEDPIDHVQRQALRADHEVHPLLERIMRIHVTEEARHLSFARHYLKRKVPKLGWLKRQVLAIETPFILGQMSSQMLTLPKVVARTYGVPRKVLAEAYGHNPESKQFVKDTLRKVRELAVELGIVTGPSKAIWKGFGIWDDPRRAAK
ncbi:MAG TPA: diiron oxygenase [Acidimicrobiales bacterium]|nr:diiron oxygenase [Acidimicrobiales bacterium]